MAVFKKEPENVEQFELRLPAQPDGANTLIIVTGRIPTSVESGERSTTGLAGASDTNVFHAGPELEPSQVRSLRATATITSMYALIEVPSAPPSGPSMAGGDILWTLGEVDAVHDDDVRKARVMITGGVHARFGGFVRIQQLSFELRIMARL